MKSIGNTPLIHLEHLPEPGSAEIYVKWEGANPSGSMKDRMALAMIEAAAVNSNPEERWSTIPVGALVAHLQWSAPQEDIGLTSYPRMHLPKRNCKQCGHLARRLR